MAVTADANITRSPETQRTTGGIFSSRSGSVPPDVLDRSRERVRVASLALFGTWLFVVIMNEVVGRFADMGPTDLQLWGPQERVLTAMGIAASLGLWWAAGHFRDRPELVLDLGLAFEVVTALIISIIVEYNLRSDPNAISWICVTIVFWPAIVPSTPRKTLIAGFASATTVPLAIWYGQLAHPGADQSWFVMLWLILPGYVCALLAVVPATVIRGLSRQVSKARELGSYRLEEQIGKGGMGEVYRATHRLLARPAAVKLISPSALSSSSDEANRVVVERFRREAQAAATLRSPHTIELYDYGVAEDGTFYYVMELLDGIDFHELVSRYGPLPAERVTHLIAQACDSLGEAHFAGLVHRDVKPSNLFACRMGLSVDYVKVLDFGLVKKDPSRAEIETHITSAGAVSGTPAFMAPESISSGSVGPAADVYALGCVAYWLLTGQNVFKAANPTMMMMQHLQSSPVPPSLKSPQPVPPALEELVMRCLAKSPEDRPPDAAELASLLAALRFTLPWTGARAQEWWMRHRAPDQPDANMTGSLIVQ